VNSIERKSLLYRSGVEYAQYAANPVAGCAHGCKYCYAFSNAKRYGKCNGIEQWKQPKLVANAPELLEKELRRYAGKIESIQFCFTSDPFMCGYPEVGDMTLRLVSMANDAGVKCNVLTKGILPIELAGLSPENEVGITLVSLDEDFRREFEPNSAPLANRLAALRALHESGTKTFISMEPYPTKNLWNQDLEDVLNAVGFVDRIIFGRWNYEPQITKDKTSKAFYNDAAAVVIEFCETNNIEYYIKDGTITQLNTG